MAFPDPLVIDRGTQLGPLAPVTPLSTNLVKVGEGRYLASNFGSPDQPVQLQIDTKMDFSGISVVTVRVFQDKNAPAGVTSNIDDRAVISLQYRIPHRSFAPADFAVLATLMAPFLLRVNLDRLFMGER